MQQVYIRAPRKRRVRHEPVTEWWLRESAAGIYQGTKKAPSETLIRRWLVDVAGVEAIKPGFPPTNS